MTGDQAQPRTAEPAGYSGERPGDPACLLRRVCQACGAVADTDPPTVCPQCGAELPGT
jgi:rubrerythrin